MSMATWVGNGATGYADPTKLFTMHVTGGGVVKLQSGGVTADTALRRRMVGRQRRPSSRPLPGEPDSLARFDQHPMGRPLWRADKCPGLPHAQWARLSRHPGRSRFAQCRDGQLRRHPRRGRRSGERQSEQYDIHERRRHRRGGQSHAHLPPQSHHAQRRGDCLDGLRGELRGGQRHGRFGKSHRAPTRRACPPARW